MFYLVFYFIFFSQEVRYFSEVYNSIKTLTDAVEESPTDVTLWIKLSRLQLNQRNDNPEGDNGEQNNGLMQSLNSLSRGLEANSNSEVHACLYKVFLICFIHCSFIIFLFYSPFHFFIHSFHFSSYQKTFLKPYIIKDYNLFYVLIFLP
jgi:hypothetical protein